MTLDRLAAERQRFARLLGIHDELGSGLPIGTESKTERSVARRDPDRESSATDRR
ncbi:hypothetical protein [Halosolutus gelatinilyticus]|uniref:hypothetical protein n=1 Tax=Halosolutus gelatinilyticus TaxID=2931975 RepID=UPI001FF2EA74|nr:hypothetical protein [Halosolutus gelatinilyticus]